MTAVVRPDPYAPSGVWRALESAAAWMLAILWVLPLIYAVWAAVHPAEFTTRFSLLAPLTLENFERAWIAAPFARYFFNTFVLVTLTLGCQFVLCTLAALRVRTLRVRWQQCGVRPGAGAAHDHARCANRGKLSHHESHRHHRHHPGDR